MRLTYSTVLLVLSLSSPVFVQTTNPVNQANTSEQEIRALDRQWSEAQEKYDAAALDRIEAHDYVATYSNGRVLTKAQELKELKTEKPKSPTVSIINDEEDVRIYGDAAVVIGRFTSKGRGWTAQFRFTRMYVKRQGQWQIVASQATTIAKQ